MKKARHILIGVLCALPLSCADGQREGGKSQKAEPALQKEMASLIQELRQQATEPLPQNRGGANNDWSRRYDEYVTRKMARRSQIIDRFTAIGKQAIPVLIEALDDDTRYGYVGRSSANAIGKINEPRSVPLLQALLAKGNSPQRRGAVEALGNMRSVESVTLLVQSLEKDKDTQVRSLSAMALGRIGSRAAVDPLAKRLASKGENDGVRARAAESLGFLKASTKIRVILTVFEQSHQKSPGKMLPANCELALRAITGKNTVSSLREVPWYTASHQSQEDLDRSVRWWRDWWERDGKLKFPQE